MSTYEYYVIESIRGFKYIVIDERKKGSKRLPKKRNIPEEEFNIKLSEVCLDIDKLKYVENLSWTAVADMYNTTAPTIRNFYMRFCK